MRTYPARRPLRGRSQDPALDRSLQAIGSSSAPDRQRACHATDRRVRAPSCSCGSRSTRPRTRLRQPSPPRCSRRTTRSTARSSPREPACAFFDVAGHRRALAGSRRASNDADNHHRRGMLVMAGRLVAGPAVRDRLEAGRERRCVLGRQARQTRRTTRTASRSSPWPTRAWWPCATVSLTTFRAQSKSFDPRRAVLITVATHASATAVIDVVTLGAHHAHQLRRTTGHLQVTAPACTSGKAGDRVRRWTARLGADTGVAHGDVREVPHHAGSVSSRRPPQASLWTRASASWAYVASIRFRTCPPRRRSARPVRALQRERPLQAEIVEFDQFARE